MRPLAPSLLTAPLALALTLALALLGLGCEYTEQYADGHLDCTSIGGSGWTRVIDDPDHCGGCGVACPTGVPCADFQCQMNSVMHCGAPGRRCFAAGDDPRGVACRAFADGERRPAGLDVVGGYGCVTIEPPRVETAPETEGPTTAGESKRSDGRWLMIPGHSAVCADGLDAPGCVTGEVSYLDGCERPVTEPLPYDFAIMTGEMSRGRFRELMCDCTEPKFGQCVQLCAERFAPNAAALAARPMTGLNWCEAYAACKQDGARLPTMRERAALEALATEPPTLFEEPLSCAAWAAETGRVPWLAECLSQPTDALELDDVKGAAGQVFVSGGALTTPEPVLHLPDNVAEWLADPASTAGSEAMSEGGRAWGLPVGGAEVAQPRLVRGRSLFSPAGQPGAQLIAVEPSVNTRDLGLRCARTVGSPFAEPVPYDATLEPRDYAMCQREPTGLRPVRQSVGEQVFRAKEVCVDSERDMPAEFREKLRERGRELFVAGRFFGPLARRAIAGQIMEIGPARFAMDEQWWLSEPVDERDEQVETRIGDVPVWLSWKGEEAPRTSDCMAMIDADPASAEAYSQLVRRHTFVLGRDYIWALGLDGLALACAHLTCSDGRLPAEACQADCPGWLLPYAIEFERVEPGSATAYCH